MTSTITKSNSLQRAARGAPIGKLGVVFVSAFAVLFLSNGSRFQIGSA
jgi:uncharacterized membrane protein